MDKITEISNATADTGIDSNIGYHFNPDQTMAAVTNVDETESLQESRSDLESSISPTLPNQGAPHEENLLPTDAANMRAVVDKEVLCTIASSHTLPEEEKMIFETEEDINVDSQPSSSLHIKEEKMDVERNDSSVGVLPLSSLLMRNPPDRREIAEPGMSWIVSQHVYHKSRPPQHQGNFKVKIEKKTKSRDHTIQARRDYVKPVCATLPKEEEDEDPLLKMRATVLLQRLDERYDVTELGLPPRARCAPVRGRAADSGEPLTPPKSSVKCHFCTYTDPTSNLSNLHSHIKLCHFEKSQELTRTTIKQERHVADASPTTQPQWCRPKTFSCEICDVNFSCIVQLKVHRLRVHQKQITNIRFQCTLCNYFYRGKHSYEAHVVKTHMIEIVKKQMMQAPMKLVLKELAAESGQVKNDMAYNYDDHCVSQCVCDLCGKKMYRLDSMAKHMIVKHGMKMPNCKIKKENNSSDSDEA